MPVLELINKSMNSHVNDFYSNNSIFIPNKFMVGFYGSYITEAMNELSQESKKAGFDGAFIENFQNFKANHYITDGNILELKWLCSTISLPTPTPVVESNFNIDTLKGIKYPLIKGYGSAPSEINLTLVENRRLQGFQFFNTLMNRFFIPQLFRARSSFHKLNMYVAVLNGDYTKAGVGRDLERYAYSTDSRSLVAIDDIPLQVFEFNSIVPTSIGKVTLTNASKPDSLSYGISFLAPDPFQGAYNTTFKGLRDNTTGKILSNGVVTDGNALKNLNISGINLTAYLPQFFEEGVQLYSYKALKDYDATGGVNNANVTSTNRNGLAAQDATASGYDAQRRLFKDTQYNSVDPNDALNTRTTDGPAPKAGSGTSKTLPVGNALGSGRFDIKSSIKP